MVNDVEVLWSYDFRKQRALKSKPVTSYWCLTRKHIRAQRSRAPQQPAEKCAHYVVIHPLIRTPKAQTSPKPTMPKMAPSTSDPPTYSLYAISSPAPLSASD